MLTSRGTFLGHWNSCKHPFHIVDPSPWAILTSIGVFGMTFGGVGYFHSFIGGGFLFFVGFLIVSDVLLNWWRDVIRESTFEGCHTEKVIHGFKLGMLLFIVSEIMFFFSFFWGFFHSSVSPSFDIGGTFPPKGIITLSPWEIPLLNTVFLLCSGITITWSHHGIIAGFRKDSFNGLFLTVFLAFIFTLLQVLEYFTAPFTISDCIYGSTFFLATGFHGFHVIVGTCFLIICVTRLFFYHFSQTHHFGFEAAAWYWHFVDAVWLFLFVTIYWWGG